MLPGVTVTVANLDTGDTRVVVTNESGLYRAPLLPLGTYRVSRGAAGLQEVRADRHHHLGRPDRGHQHQAERRRAAAETITVTADAPLVDLGRIEQGRTLTEAEIKTLPLTSRNPYNFALLQPGVVGFENSGVRRAAHHRQRRAAARQLPDRRQQQHAEGSRRPAPDADVGGDDPRGEGRHHRLRAGVRPDDGADLQRDHAVGHEHVQGAGQLSLAAASRSRRSRSSRRARTPPTASRRPTSTSSPSTSAVRSCATGRTSSAATSTPSAICRARAVITITPANQAALGLTEPPYMPTRAQHRVRHRQGRSPVQRQQPAVGALHLLRQLHHQQHRRRHQLGAARHRLQRSAALDGGAADLDDHADAAERAARAVRDARAGPRAGRAGRHRAGDQHHQRRQLRRSDRRRRRRRVSRSPRTCSRSTTT